MLITLSFIPRRLLQNQLHSEGRLQAQPLGKLLIPRAHLSVRSHEKDVSLLIGKRPVFDNFHDLKYLTSENALAASTLKT